MPLIYCAHFLLINFFLVFHSNVGAKLKTSVYKVNTHFWVFLICFRVINVFFASIVCTQSHVFYSKANSVDDRTELHDQRYCLTSPSYVH